MWRLFLAQVTEAVPAESSPVTAPGSPAAPGAAGGNPLTGMLPMVVVFIGIMYFMMIRPQQKREKERREMLNSVAKGDQVVTTGGICGEVVKVTDTAVTLRVDQNVNIEFVRAAVAQITSRTGDSKKK